MNIEKPRDVTATEAQADLDRAASMTVTSTKDLRTLQLVTVGIGVAMALVLVLIKAMGDNLWGFAIGMTVYGLAIGLLVWTTTKVRSAPRGYAKRYGSGIAGTSGMYGLAIALTAGRDASWPMVIGLAVLTVVPALIAAYSMSTLVKK